MNKKISEQDINKQLGIEKEELDSTGSSEYIIEKNKQLKILDRLEKYVLKQLDVDEFTAYNESAVNNNKWHHFNSLLVKYSRKYDDLKDDMLIRYSELYTEIKTGRYKRTASTKQEIDAIIYGEDSVYMEMKQLLNVYKQMVEYLKTTNKMFETRHWTLKYLMEYERKK